MNWRDQYEVNVGWVGRPELGFLRCRVYATWLDTPGHSQEPHPVKSVRWAASKIMRVSWCDSQQRYVFI